MIRTQIQLTEDQAHGLKAIARREGVSIAEVIRRCVAERLADEGRRSHRYQAAWGFVAGAGRANLPEDLAEEHDRYLDEAFEGQP